MSPLADQIRPGEVISSDLMKYILTKLDELEQKLGSVTPGTGVISIDGFEPIGPLAVGENLIIKGQGFSTPVGLNKVVLTPLPPGSIVDPIQIPLPNFFSFESSATRIKFQVPVLPGISSTGQNVLVSVTNAGGQKTERQYMLKAASNAPPTQIFGFDPPTGQAVGQKLKVLGANFDLPSRLNQVVLRPQGGGGVTTDVIIQEANFAKYASESSLSQLVFELPTIAGIPTGGQQFLVRVTSMAGGTVEQQYTLRPPLPVTGPPPEIVSILNTATQAAILQAGNDADINGKSFGPTPTDNVVTFIVTQGTSTFPYIATVKAVSGAGDNMKLTVTVPNITQLPAVGGGSLLIPVSLKVGNHPEVSRQVAVRRPNP